MHRPPRLQRDSIMYQQIFDPVAHSLSWSALFAALPLLTLFVLLGVLRWEARWASLTALAVSIIVAIGIYRMPLGQSLSGAAEGAAVGFFPILWVGINAIWVYKLTEVSGHSVALRRTASRVQFPERRCAGAGSIDRILLWCAA
jgi:lactate permease